MQQHKNIGQNLLFSAPVTPSTLLGGVLVLGGGSLVVFGS